LRTEKIQIVLLGRPYVAFDPVMNLGILQKLEELGAEIYWQEEFNLDEYEPAYANKFYERMHWHYGKQIIKLAEFWLKYNRDVPKNLFFKSYRVLYSKNQ
ncbi:MAG: acyl-CoA dehydratase activase-related protein, partial [Omnitrophica bacterium]|nr:acyl-CoA dehydratase activase-related protein [Candidatus Omnitrophota bacterium]